MNTKFNIGEALYVLNGNSMYKGSVSEIRIDGTAKAHRVQYSIKNVGTFLDENLYKTFELATEALKERIDGN